MCPDDVGDICSNFLFLMAGFDVAQMNKTLLPEIVKVRGMAIKMRCSY